MSERLLRVAELYGRSSAVLEGATHRAADGHVVSTREAMGEAAKLHWSASPLPEDGAGE